MHSAWRAVGILVVTGCGGGVSTVGAGGPEPIDAAMTNDASSSFEASSSFDASTDASCGFQLGGPAQASIVGTFVSAATDGTEIPFIGLQCTGSANGTTYSVFADFLPGDFSISLSSSATSQSAFQGCAYTATRNGTPVDGGTGFGGTGYALGDPLQVSFDDCSSSGPDAGLFLMSGYFSAVVGPKP
jgi:hypothetical protein